MKSMYNSLCIRILIAGYFSLLIPLYAIGQSGGFAGKIVKNFDRYTRNTLLEKIYLHTDRSTYLAGETMWFKLYYVDGYQHKPLDISKVAYLEVLDKDRKPVLQSAIALSDGMGNGSLFIPASLNSGNYLIRAYTNWMKNFSPEFYFEKRISIINTFKQLGLQAANDSAAYDIQFFPEGGNMVDNIAGKVAFRVTDVQGKGTDVQGAVLNQANDTVATFNTARFGIGHFYLTPQAGNEYRALMHLTDGKVVSRKLPVAYAEGYTMQLENAGAEQLKITVQAKLPSSAASYVYLLAHTRQELKAAQQLTLQDNKAIFIIDRNKLGEGISHLTLFDANNRPVCERLYFRKPANPMVIDVKPEQNQVSTRKKISLAVSASDGKGVPLVANMSLSVYKVDSLQPTSDVSMLNYLWLTSDLTGNIESPEYYFGNNAVEVEAAADNLMLTHGWRRFRWQDMLAEDSLTYGFIPEFGGQLVQGRVVHTAEGTPINNINTFLSVPGRQSQLYFSRSDENGTVQYELKNIYGNKQIITQPYSVQDSLYHIEIITPFSQNFSAKPIPDFYLSGDLKEQVLNRNIAMQTQNTYFTEQRNKFLPVRVDSAAFYGIPDASYNLDNYTRFPLMEDILKEYVPGVQARKRRGKFYLEVLDLPHKLNFNENPLVLLDGVPIADVDKIMAFSLLRIKKLDVINRKYFFGPATFSGILSLSTYRGDLAGFPLSTSSVIIDYEGLQMQREFYAPLYDTQEKQASRLPDYRHLLHWVPSFTTDTAGKHTLEFYTSDLEGEYRIVIEGITKQGQAGYGTASFTVLNRVN